MDIYKYISDNYDAITLKDYLDTNMVEACYPSTVGSTISIQTEADKATLDLVMDAYLAQDNVLEVAKIEAVQNVTEIANRKTRNIIPNTYTEFPAAEMHLMMDMIALARKEANALATAQDVLDLDYGEDIRSQIKAVRTASQEIILDIDASLDPLSIDLENHLAWP